VSVKIRLTRIGKRDDPKYRVIAIDSHKRRDASALEQLGTYDPMENPAKVTLKKDRIDYWISKGALVSEAVAVLIKK